MLYEIKVASLKKDGRNSKESFITEGFEFTTKEGLQAVRFVQHGKTRNTWIQVPNDFQMKNYFGSFELTICEATTGKNIHKIVK